MEIFFHDPEDAPLPPDEVHIRTFTAQPYPDGRRVKVYLEISPFQKRPSGDISIYNDTGQLAASVSIIETIDPKMEMTMHLRAPSADLTYTVKAEIFYEELPEVEENGQAPLRTEMPERTMVAQSEITFQVGE